MLSSRWYATAHHWAKVGRAQCLLVKIRKQFSITCCIDSKKGDALPSENSLLSHVARCLILVAWPLRVSTICWSIT